MTLKTIRTYIGDGATTIYSIDFQLGYINKDYVYVYLDTDTYATQLDYVWLNAAQIEITTAVANGVSFNIRRIVPRDQLVNDYTDGAILRELNLDNSYKQALMWLEEVADGFANVSGELYSQANLNMLGNRIVELGNATSARDAVPLAQVQGLIDTKFDLIDTSNPDVDSGFKDYGRVSQTISVYEDYGLITDTPTTLDDYGSV